MTSGAAISQSPTNENQISTEADEEERERCARRLMDLSALTREVVSIVGGAVPKPEEVAAVAGIHAMANELEKASRLLRHAPSADGFKPFTAAELADASEREKFAALVAGKVDEQHVAKRVDETSRSIQAGTLPRGYSGIVRLRIADAERIATLLRSPSRAADAFPAIYERTVAALTREGSAQTAARKAAPELADLLALVSRYRAAMPGSAADMGREVEAAIRSLHAEREALRHELSVAHESLDREGVVALRERAEKAEAAHEFVSGELRIQYEKLAAAEARIRELGDEVKAWSGKWADAVANVETVEGQLDVERAEVARLRAERPKGALSVEEAEALIGDFATAFRLYLEAPRENTQAKLDRRRAALRARLLSAPLPAPSALEELTGRTDALGDAARALSATCTGRWNAVLKPEQADALREYLRSAAPSQPAPERDQQEAERVASELERAKTLRSAVLVWTVLADAIRLLRARPAAQAEAVEQEPVAFMSDMALKSLARARAGGADDNDIAWARPRDFRIPLYTRPQAPQGEAEGGERIEGFVHHSVKPGVTASAYFTTDAESWKDDACKPAVLLLPHGAQEVTK